MIRWTKFNLHNFNNKKSDLSWEKMHWQLSTKGVIRTVFLQVMLTGFTKARLERIALHN